MGSSIRLPIPIWSGEKSEIVEIPESQIVSSYHALLPVIRALKAEQYGGEGLVKVLREAPRGFKVAITDNGQTGGEGLRGIVIVPLNRNGSTTLIVSTKSGVFEKSIHNVKASDEKAENWLTRLRKKEPKPVAETESETEDPTAED